MKTFYFGLISLVWFSSPGCAQDISNFLSVYSPENEVLFNNPPIHIQAISIPFFDDAKKDLWDLVKSFRVCELRCNGKHCACCQKTQIFFLHLGICFNSHLKPSENKTEIYMSAGSTKLFSVNVKLDKVRQICKPVTTKFFDGELCVYTELMDYGDDGFSVCARVDLNMKDITMFQVNFDCFSYEGDIIVNGRQDEDKRTIAFLKVMNPLKFIELLKKIFLQKK